MIKNMVVKDLRFPNPLPHFVGSTRDELLTFCGSIFAIYDPTEAHTETCVACGKFSLWVDGQRVWPARSGVKPSKHMPDDVRVPFEEAQSISNTSPWAACALLRICLERLVEHLGGEGKNLYQRIESLDLAADEKPLWDAIRRIGNDAAHEGLFPYDGSVTVDVANVVSGFVNLLVERHIGARADALHLLSVLNAAQGKAPED